MKWKLLGLAWFVVVTHSLQAAQRMDKTAELALELCERSGSVKEILEKHSVTPAQAQKVMETFGEAFDDQIKVSLESFIKQGQEADQLLVDRQPLQEQHMSQKTRQYPILDTIFEWCCCPDEDGECPDENEERQRRPKQRDACWWTFFI